MTTQEPFERFLEEMTKIVNLTESKEFKELKKVPKNLSDSLQLLEIYVNSFRSMNEKVMKDLGISQNDIKAALEDVDQFASKDKRMLNRFAQTKSELNEKKIQAEKQLTLIKEKEKKSGTASAKQREKKFYRSGSRKGWKPL